MALVAALLLVFAACSSDKKASTSAGSGSSSSSSSGSSGSDGGGAQTLPVQVDAQAGENGVSFTSFFPSELTAHPGDTLDFTEVFTGEPHTVTFGALVDQGFAKLDPNAQDEPAELKKIPNMLPDGPGDAIQAAAQPCFLATGEPPASDACTKDQQKPVPFDGTQPYYNSGFLEDGDHFKVELADDIKPGTYNWFCTIHRGGMAGKVTVVAADAKAQSADEVKAAGETALKAAQAKAKTTVDAVKAGTLPPFIPAAAPGQVIAGGGSEDQQDAVPVIFGPDKVDIKVGESVTWTVVGPHSVTFGASEAQRTLFVKAPDGAVHLNEEGGAPAGGEGQPQGPPADPSAPPGPPVVIDGGSYDGTSFHSSGLVLSFPPNLFAYKMTFTKAGSFPYICVVHPDMKGIVNVS
jgi:plastocyanin